MIVDELAARFSFSVEGIAKIQRAIALLGKMQRAILAVAAAIAKRLGRVASILVRTTAAAVAFGSAFVTSAGLITMAAGTATLALAGLAAGFAKLRQTTIDSAFLSGVPIQQLALIEKVMTRIGASAKDGRQFVSDFTKKIAEGLKEGGDWTETLSKQGVKLKDAKGKAKSYSHVIDDILKAADKMKDADKRRDFLKEGLEGAPDELIAQLLQSTSAFKRWETLVGEARKAGGNMPLGDVLNSQDITNALGRIQTAMQGFADAFGGGLMASFAQNFREFGEAVMNFATDERRAKFRQFAGDLAQFTKDVTKGGFIVLSKVAGAIGSIVDALKAMDEATGGRLKALGIGIGLLIGGVTAVAAGPIIAVSGAITAILFGIKKFAEWKDGGTNVLSEFFDAIAASAQNAKKAIEGFLSLLPSLSPKAPAGAQGNQRLQNYIDGLERLDQLRKKSGEMSPGAVSSKLASDRTNDNRQNFQNDQRHMPVSISLSGIEQSSIPSAIMGAVNQAVSMIKATNASTVPGGAQ